MEIQSPVKLQNGSYKAPITTDEPFVAIYTSRETDGQVTPPDTDEKFREFCTALANLYDTYSQKWFQKSVPIFAFMRNLAHNWTFGTHEAYRGAHGEEYRVRQVWRPDHLVIEARSIQLVWVLEEVSYHNAEMSGSDGTAVLGAETDLLPLSQEAPIEIRPGIRERALRKVREARLQASIAELRVRQLTFRYYERYGTAEFADGDSVLSSDEDDK